MLQSYVGIVGNPLTADGAAVTGTVAGSLLGTTVAAADARPTLPNNFFQIGKKLRIKGAGRLSNIVTTPGTLTLDIRFGSTVVFTSQAMQLSTTAHTNATFRFEIELTCRAVGGGTTTTLWGSGLFFSKAVSLSAADPTSGDSFLLMPETTPTTGTGFDSSATQQIDNFATFSLTGNSITLQDFSVEALN
jgi:hypothetical protein